MSDIPGLIDSGFKARREFRNWRNKKRAEKGLPLKGVTMLPSNTITPAGGIIATVSPIATTILVAMGVGECTPESVEAGCVGATQIVGIIGTIIGGVLILIGKLRSMKREKALKAELAAKSH